MPNNIPDGSMIGENYNLTPKGIREIEKKLGLPDGISPTIVKKPNEQESNAAFLARMTQRAISIGWSYNGSPFKAK